MVMRLSALLLVVTLGVAGCAGPSTGIRGARLNATEKMMWSTYPLGTQKGMATGFVVGWKDARRPGVVVPVIVTAGHLLDSVGKGPLVMAVRVPVASGEPKVAVIQVTPRRSGARLYVRHPRQDVGAFEPNLPMEATSLILSSYLNEKSLADGAGALRVGDEVSFLGFPDVVPGTSGGFPVLRSGKVASYPETQLRAEGAFLINADVYPGDSGAPVFASRHGGAPVLLGMVIQRVGRNERAFSHFAIAVDAKAIRETLDLLASPQTSPPKKRK